jgi:hypothetical protein
MRWAMRVPACRKHSMANASSAPLAGSLLRRAAGRGSRPAGPGGDHRPQGRGTEGCGRGRVPRASLGCRLG